MILFYVRHGDPIYSPNSLTPLGYRQAEATAKRLALYGIDEIYSSPSQRAVLTAKPTAEITKKEIKELDFCDEKYAFEDFSVMKENGKRAWVFQEMHFKKLFAGKEVLSLGDKWYEYPEFKKQNFERGVKRIDSAADEFLLSLGYEHDREKHIYNPVNPNEKRIALFAHKGFGLYFLSSILDIPYPLAANRFDMCHTGVTVILFDNDEGECLPRLLTLSNDSHLFREGLPTYCNTQYKKTIRF